MYVAICFCVLLIATMFAWFGKRDSALLVFSLAMIMAIGTFFHHMTSVLGLSL